MHSFDICNLNIIVPGGCQYSAVLASKKLYSCPINHSMCSYICDQVFNAVLENTSLVLPNVVVFMGFLMHKLQYYGEHHTMPSWGIGRHLAVLDPCPQHKATTDLQSPPVCKYIYLSVWILILEQFYTKNQYKSRQLMRSAIYGNTQCWNSEFHHRQ